MKKYLVLFLGILISTLGIAFVVKSNLGAFPVTCLNIGFSNSTGLSLGTASFLIELILLVFNVKFNEKIGVGTIVNSFIAGYVLDFHLSYIPTAQNIFISIPMILLGMFVLSYGFYLITKAGLGNNASNGFMMVLHKLTGISLGNIRTVEEIAFATIGFLLGGPIGIATIVLSLSFGKVMELVYKVLKFNPTDVKHEFISFKKSRG